MLKRRRIDFCIWPFDICGPPSCCTFSCFSFYDVLFFDEDTYLPPVSTVQYLSQINVFVRMFGVEQLTKGLPFFSPVDLWKPFCNSSPHFLSRDKSSLESQISKLKISLESRDGDFDGRYKRGSDAIEQQLREERNNLEAELRRLKVFEVRLFLFQYFQGLY